MANNENSPVAEIIVVDTDKIDLRGYFPYCLENILPYQNNDHSPKRNGLITVYDQARREDIKEGGPHHEALLARLQKIASKINCNLLFWSSEGSKCRKPEIVKKEIDRVLPTNDFPTVVLLTGCDTDEYAFEYNQGKKRILFNGNKPSKQALFLGFDHQIHRLKDDVFMCEEPMKDFPMLTCKGEAISKEKAIADGLTNEQGEILQAARDSENEKVQCCIDRTEGFPHFFVEEFKGKRNCGKLDWTKLEERVANILSKKDTRDTITKKDSSIRWSEDTIKCQSKVGEQNPCGIVNIFPKKPWAEHNSKFTNDVIKWGKLMANLKVDTDDYGSSGNKFIEIIKSIPEDKLKELVNTKDKNGETILYKLVLPNQIIDRKKKILKLIELGASLDEINKLNENQKQDERSFQETLIEESAFWGIDQIHKELLFELNFNLASDRSFKRKLDYVKVTNGNKLNTKQKLVTNVINKIKKGFVLYIQDIIIKDIYNKSTKPNREKNVLFQRLSKKFFEGKTEDFLNTFKEVKGKDLHNQYDNATEILNVLKNKRDGKTNYEFMSEAMALLNTRAAKNILPLNENAAPASPPSGGKRLTRKRKFSKRSSTGKKRRATNAK